jgi:hypothetical protein
MFSLPAGSSRAGGVESEPALLGTAVARLSTLRASPNSARSTRRRAAEKLWAEPAWMARARSEYARAVLASSSSNDALDGGATGRSDAAANRCS